MKDDKKILVDYRNSKITNYARDKDRIDNVIRKVRKIIDSSSDEQFKSALNAALEDLLERVGQHNDSYEESLIRLDQMIAQKS